MSQGSSGKSLAFCYRLFGLTCESAIALPELEPADPAATADVVILTGEVAPDAAASDSGPMAVGSGAFTLAVPEVARFRVSNGEEIVVAAEPGSSEADVRLFLLGSAMGLLLHQRKILPLHANAIELNGRAVAVIGHPGAGKSTLAAAFHDGGHPLLSDDVCAVTSDHGVYMVQPGIPRVRLWRDALERSGREASDHVRAFSKLDKYTVATQAERRATARPLGAIYHISRPDRAIEDFSFERLTGTAATKILIENTYRGMYVSQAGDPVEYFRTCTALAAAVPVFRFVRPWAADRIDESVSALLRHASS